MYVHESFSAPNNQAFADLDPKPNSTEELTSVLTYHVIPGVALSSETLKFEAATTSYETVNGANITTNVRFNGFGGGSILVIEGGTIRAEVIEADIDACNGVIHIIDKVLLPPDPEQR